MSTTGRPVMAERPSVPRVRHACLAPLDEIAQRLVAPVFERRRLVSGEHAFPLRVGAPREVERSLFRPLLERVVVGKLVAIERGLVISHGVLRAEKVLAGSDLA